MCGRDSGNYTWAEVAAFSQPLILRHPELEPAANFNRAPATLVWTLTGESGQLHARQLRWGLLPAWSQDQTRYAINARVESAAEKPSFRDALRKAQRCLIPASGYYEWGLGPGGKQPYYIQAKHESLLMFAGLWEHHPKFNIDSYCILTQPALPEVAHVHDRSPLILPASAMAEWLFGDPADALPTALRAPPPALRLHAVDQAVGNARSHGAQLILPVSARADLFSTQP
jgi:putative SOS response-associated peptidase YedK